MKGVSVEYPMYYGAPPSIFKLAKELRKNETEAEKVLWARLNSNQIMGLHFRRQHPLNMFIADFFCPEIKLDIEIDGSIHSIVDYQAHDAGRTDVLNDFGITVIRFVNEQVLNEMDYTIYHIQETAQKLLKSKRLDKD
jgi:very-short-patch-repair endonuclease